MRPAGEILDGVEFAVLVRDVRDVAASQLMRIRKQRADPAWYDPAYVRAEGERYSDLYGRLADCAPALNDRVVLIRYETLVRECPLDQLQRLLDLPGLDASRLWKRADFDIRDMKDNEAFAQLYGKPISASSIGRHEKVLRPEDAEALAPARAAAEDVLRRFSRVLA